AVRRSPTGPRGGPPPGGAVRPMGRGTGCWDAGCLSLLLLCGWFGRRCTRSRRRVRSRRCARSGPAGPSSLQLSEEFGAGPRQLVLTVGQSAPHRGGHGDGVVVGGEALDRQRSRIGDLVEGVEDRV